MGDKVMERYRAPALRGDRAALEQQVGSDSVVVHARGDNPLCGDVVEVAVALGELPDGSMVVERACWDGYGCSLCIAAAEVLLEAAQGRCVSEVLALDVAEILHWLGDPAVSRSRMGCARLPVEVLARALAQPC